MRSILLLLSFAVAGQASASFDLLLVLDSSQNVVHRYDADSGTYLGSFGQGTLANVRGIGVNQAAGTAIVTHSQGYSVWNYNTGAFLFYNTTFSNTYNDVEVLNDGRLLLTSTNGSFAGGVFANATDPVGLSFPLSTGGGPFSTAFQRADGGFVAYNTSSGPPRSSIQPAR